LTYPRAQVLKSNQYLNGRPNRTFITKLTAYTQYRQPITAKKYYRLYAPIDAVTEIGAKGGEMVMVNISKAPWWATVNWLEMQDAWKTLPPSVKRLVEESGIPHPEANKNGS